MADSENSRTLPAITCRNSLQIAEWFLFNNFSDQELWSPSLRDGVLTKWHAWNRAFQELAAIGRAQQKLESQLMCMAPALQVEVVLPNSAAPFITSSISEIQDRLRGNEFRVARAKAEADLLAKHKQWEAVDESLGYSRARRAEDEASLVEERLALDLSQAPGMTTVAVAAKLHCILERGSPRPDSNEFPWPQIRSVLIDILAMHGVFSKETCAR
ncbi:hypothetical protein RHIZ_21060 [Rhizobium skierniewicense]|uniref:hypothetical protein n=1 Tax=Rhizobium skierniewicense TaxID=984260 RepID=UPI001FAB67FF|nr:hypothetical protein [Rhizobium skierniewicense]MCI9868459.1 hypothetical protein [Rhizobium skierniewicense]